MHSQLLHVPSAVWFAVLTWRRGIVFAACVTGKVLATIGLIVFFHVRKTPYRFVGALIVASGNRLFLISLAHNSFSMQRCGCVMYCCFSLHLTRWSFEQAALACMLRESLSAVIEYPLFRSAILLQTVGASITVVFALAFIGLNVLR